MKIAVELPDAFETVEVDLPENLYDWFTREAKSKNVSLEQLLAGKASGLTVNQLRVAREHGTGEAYVFRWILNQTHQIGSVNSHIVPAPFVTTPAQGLRTCDEAPPKARRGPHLYWLPGNVDHVPFGIAAYRTAHGAWLDITLRSHVLRFLAWGSDD